MSEKNFRLLIGGDIFPTNNNLESFKCGESDKLYDSAIMNMFADADFSICNLEGALADKETPIKKVDPIIAAPASAIAGINALKVKCLTLANNHIADYGREGYLSTVKVLEDNGIRYFGAGEKNSIKKYISINADGRNVVIYNVSETMFNIPCKERPGANLYDEYQVCNELKELKNQADYLIVIYHGGTEFFWYGSELLRKRFHRMADCGADVVIAQHTHCVGMDEIYNGSSLFYGQGDFLFARSQSVYKATGLLIEIVFEENKTEVRKYLLQHVGGKVILDPNQDFSVFEERNEKLKNGETFEKEYSEYSDERVIKFLDAFRGSNFFDKVFRRILPRKLYIRYIRNRFRKKDLLRIISALQFEEFNEFVVQALWNMVDDK